MQVQRIVIPATSRVTWLVIDDSFLSIRPVNDFLMYLENLERSPHTVRAYAHHLKLFWEFLQDTGREWTTVGLSDLAEYVAWLRQPHSSSVTSMHEQVSQRSESTINAILAPLSIFYDYHQRVGTVNGIPMFSTQALPHRRYKSFLHHINKSNPLRTRLIKLKAPKRLPRTLTRVQVQALIHACHRRRDKFLLSLLYETGMRIGQALGLRHEDVRSWDNLIQVVPRADNANGVRAKTLETYPIHVSMELMTLYQDYLIYEYGDMGSDYVFVNLWDGLLGRPMTYETVVALFRRLTKKTGIRVRPHMLRHTHATELLRSGCHTSVVQKRLGHVSVQSTHVYLEIIDDDLKQAHQKFLQSRKD